MKLSKVTLEKDRQIIVLQGMIHIAPDKLYKEIRDDLDQAIKNNYQIFFEGVKQKPEKKSATRNERRIRKFFNIIFDLYPAWAEALGVSTQKEKISYPKDAINADIAFSKMTKLLDEQGFRCNLMLWLLRKIPRNKLEEGMIKDCSKKNFNDIMDETEKKLIGNLITKLFWRKAMPIINDYRNEVAVAIIKKKSDGRNIYIHYGEKHVQDLIKLFEKGNWRVKEIKKRDLANYC